MLLFMAAPSHAAESASSYLKRPDDWFRSEEARRIAENIISWQSPLGSWPKNTNTVTARYAGDPVQLRGTFDNGATLGELRFLARAFHVLKDVRCEQAFLKGFDHILKAQYSNGGWPQYYPAGKGYPRFITFNDNAMVRLMEFEREVAQSPLYDFVDAARRKAAQESFDRGIQCILKCQIKRDGKLTAWCAQHDEVDFRPRPARTYELASLSGAESVGLVKLLMSLDHPGPEVVQAIDSAVAWFEAAKLTGIRVTQEKDPQSPKGWDKRVVKDPAAPPLWARFYDIATNKPIFADRDGVPKSSLAEIGQWPWPRKILAQLVLNAMQMGAAQVAFDVVFAEPDRMNPSSIIAALDGIDDETRKRLQQIKGGDALFADAIKKSRVVLGQAGYWEELETKPTPPGPNPLKKLASPAGRVVWRSLWWRELPLQNPLV
jgi:pectate lyase